MGKVQKLKQQNYTVRLFAHVGNVNDVVNQITTNYNVPTLSAVHTQQQELMK